MRCLAVVFSLAALLPSIPLHAAQATAATRPRPVSTAGQNSAPVSINGTVVTSAGQLLPNTVVRARNLLTGRIAGTTSTTGNGQFALTGLDAGRYVLEAVDPAGQILGTSSFIFAAAGTTVAATVTATSGAMSAVNPATGFAATLTSTAAQSVKYAAVAAGVAGMVTPVDVATASPSR
jgi:Carboxypeptidase regulatory-like domain